MYEEINHNRRRFLGAAAMTMSRRQQFDSKEMNHDASRND